MSFHHTLASIIAFLCLLGMFVILKLRLFEPGLGADVPDLTQRIFALGHACSGSAWALAWCTKRLELVAVVLEHIGELFVEFGILLAYLAHEGIIFILSLAYCRTTLHRELG